MKKLLRVLVPFVVYVVSFMFVPPHEVTNHERSEAMTALEFWTAQRAYPDRTIPDNRYFAAYQYSRTHLNNQADESADDTWQQIGPHNIGGRTLAVAFNPLNPNTVYAGSASGGLWRSYTGGVGRAAWQRVRTGFPVLGVSSIAIAPDDSNTIYIGTGEVYAYQNSIGGLSVRTTRGSYGFGILKTTNGGASWTKALDWSYNQKRGVQALYLNPLNRNTIWAATTEGTYKSTNAGSSWNLMHNVIMATDVALSAIDTNTVFVACGNLGSTGNGIYRSTDGGGTFAKLTNGLPSSYGGKTLLAISPSSPNIIFASIGNGSNMGSGTWLVRSTNNGDSWVTLSTSDYSTYQGWYSHFVVVHPTDTSKILTGGIDMWKSTNGGRNLLIKSDWSAWYFGTTPPGGPEGPSNYSHADHHAYAIHPTNPNTVYLANDGGIFRTTDFGETFSGCNGGYQTTQFYNGFSCSPMDTTLAMGGMQDNATAIRDSGVAWRRVIGGDGCWTAVHPANPDTLYGTSQNLNLLKSTNRGGGFFGIGVPGSSFPTSFAAPFVLSPSNPRIMYAGRDRVYRSTVGGGSWVAPSNVALDGNPLIALAVSPTDPNVVYAGTAPVSSRSRLFASTNGGTNWANVTGTLPDRYPVDLHVDPSQPGTVYVAFSGYGTSHVFRSTDFGQSWTDIGATLPDVPTSAVVVDPIRSSTIYVGNDIGVYVSTNGGSSWAEFQSGLPEAVIVMDLTISSRNRMLRAATHGNGAYERRLLESPTDVAQTGTPADFRLEQNYPNPFNPTTTIKYLMPEVRSLRSEVGRVTVKVFDALGREVATLVDKAREPGEYRVNWDANGFPSGVYFYRIQAGTFVSVRKMVLLR